MTHLRVVEPEKDGERYEKSSPDIDCFDAQVGGIGTDHVRDCPLEDDTAIVLEDIMSEVLCVTYKPRP